MADVFRSARALPASPNLEQQKKQTSLAGRLIEGGAAVSVPAHVDGRNG